MSNHIMLDAESLGNNNDSQLLSIGACLFNGKLDIDFEGKPHHALDGAVWQAKYVAAACERLGLTL